MSDDDYTPSTDEVRDAWGGFLNYGGLTDAPRFLATEEGYAAFDRWLESVEAAAEQRGAEKERAQIVARLGAAAGMEAGR